MNTKTFAQQARRLLIDGVAKKLLYWGFDTKGNIIETPQKVSGGYSFRGDVFDDPNVLRLWESLKTAVQHKSIEVVVEEAAYTWFNRIMALRIMAKNGYETSLLVNAEGLEHTPVLLQKARQGQYSFLNKKEQERLKKIIGDYSKDQEAFSMLLIGYCHSNTMLNNVFGKIDDYTELLLPDNMLQDSGFLHLLNTTDAISDTEYQEVELIGWLYQFYISEKKDDVFASFKKGKKAEAKDIPAATQIFTPNWIVKYMVQNTAGKIWLDKKPNSPLKTSMKYLVENDSDNTNESIINNVEELTLIDPAAGSGHILVEGFDLLYQMYMEEYYTPEEAVESILKNNLFGLDIDDRAAQLATFAILLKAAKYYRDIFSKGWLPNVYAMPEDQLQNWFTTKSYGYSPDWEDLQGMMLTAPVTVEWTEHQKDKEVPKKVTFRAGNILNEKVVEILGDYYKGEISVDFSKELELFWGDFEKPYNYSDFFYAINLLRQGKNLGSVIKCNINTEVRNHIVNTYNNWLEREKKLELDIEEITILNALKTYIPVLLLLTKKYTAVVANPPYMGAKTMNLVLKKYVNTYYPISKSDLCTVFLEVLPFFTKDKGKYGFIVPPSWMFLISFSDLRNHILKNQKIDSLLHLSRGVFGADFGSVSAVITNESAAYNDSGTYLRLIQRTFQEIYQGDLNELLLIANGNENFKYDFSKYSKNNPNLIHSDAGTRIFYQNILQSNFLLIEGNPLAYWISRTGINAFEKYDALKEYALPKQGLSTTNNNKFLRYWAEVTYKKIKFNATNRKDTFCDLSKWYPYQKGGGLRKWYGNNDSIINWQNDGKEIHSYIGQDHEAYGAPLRGKKYLFRKGISWSSISSSNFACRYVGTGSVFDAKGPMLIPNQDISFHYLMSYLNSIVADYFFKALAPTMDFNQGPVGKQPLRIQTDKIESIKDISSKNIEISSSDWDLRETSWDFEQSPLLNKNNSLKSAYQQWQENVTQDFFQLHKNEEELNRIFINIYGLQEELTPEVALKDITILQEELNGKDLEKLEPLFREKGANAITLPFNKEKVISQFISYAIGLFMGRYRLDTPSLNIAHPNPTAEELASYSYNNSTVTIDEDAILPLMGKNCNFQDDALQQINQLLDTIWGHETRIENNNFVQECLSTALEKFLVKDFYKYHCGMYKKKPIYWLFSSKTGAFQVLVYMHRMNAFTVEKIRANYMLEHLKNLRSEENMLQANSATLNTQDAKRLDQIRKELVDCEAYDMELKNVADQQITFDLDDGVTVNYAKFESVLAKIK